MSEIPVLSSEEQLLTDIRSYLDITWVDPAGDQKLVGLIARGVVYLNDLAGTGLDYLTEGQARALLFDYVRYARSNVLDEFAKNFQQEIIRFQLAQEVAAYEAAAAGV